MTTMTDQRKAHRSAVQTSFAELVTTLEELLGRSLVAVIGDVDAKTVARWAKGRTSPRAEPEARVRTAFLVAQLLLARESDHTVRAWFIGLNPQLEDIAPAEALRAGQLRDVVVAAKSFTLGG